MSDAILTTLATLASFFLTKSSVLAAKRHFFDQPIEEARDRANMHERWYKEEREKTDRLIRRIESLEKELDYAKEETTKLRWHLSLMSPASDNAKTATEAIGLKELHKLNKAHKA